MTEPISYRRAGKTVEAMQYLPDTATFVAQWCGGVQIPPVPADLNFASPRMLHIFHASGVSVARHGDYVVKDPFGKFYACPEHVFIKTYEEITV